MLLLIGLGFQNGTDWEVVKERVRQDFPAVEQISVTALHTWLQSADPPPLLLDVREEAEYRVSHLPGAVRVDPGTKFPELPEGVGLDTPIVAYCSVGYRSSALAAHLEELGFNRVVNLEGSIFEWANEGFPVVREGEEVREVHPYDKLWGRLLIPELRTYSVD